MPWTISWLIEVQRVPGKSYNPLNAGVAPWWLRMNSSAIASRSSVDIPARTSRRSICTVAARILPPSAIVSISRALLSWIIRSSRVSLLRGGSGDQGAERPGRHVLDRAHGVDRRDLGAMLTIPLEHRLGLPAVDVEPVADRLGLVVLAADHV